MNELFNVSGERESVPTLREFLKSNGSKRLAKVYPVMVIWKPSRYPNIVFQTERFRAIVYKGDSAYEAILSRLDELTLNGTGLGISPDSNKPGQFTVSVLDGESVHYEDINGLGWRANYGG